MSRRLLATATCAAALLAPAAAANAQSPIPQGMDPGENAKLAISALDTINVVLEPADHAKYADLFTGPINPLPPGRLSHTGAVSSRAWTWRRSCRSFCGCLACR